MTKYSELLKYKGISGIYKITNIANGKFYIGSAIDLVQRNYLHINQIQNKKHHNILIQRSFDKYGLECFKFDIIELTDNLIEREQYYIDTLKPEFNICKIAGNTQGVLASQETRDKMSKKHKGRKQNEEWIRKRIPEKGSEIYKNRIISDKERERRSKQGCKNQKQATISAKNKSSKPIFCYNNNKIYLNCIEAGKDLNLQHSSINRVCNGIYKHTHNYKFIYSSDLI